MVVMLIQGPNKNGLYHLLQIAHIDKESITTFTSSFSHRHTLLLFNGIVVLILYQRGRSCSQAIFCTSIFFKIMKFCFMFLILLQQKSSILLFGISILTSNSFLDLFYQVQGLSFPIMIFDFMYHLINGVNFYIYLSKK